MSSNEVLAARTERRDLKDLMRPTTWFDASRYFRGDHQLQFFNIGSARVRMMARAVVKVHADTWSVDDAMAFADELIADRTLEVKGLAVEVVARYRRSFRPELLAAWKRWLSLDYASNWATTDAICGLLIGPLLLDRPALVATIRGWSRHRNLWVRRAAVVGLIPSLRRGLHLDLGYRIASDLHPDRHDLIQKAVGWMLREAGKADVDRLERHLKANGPAIPRTTVRYAIERFPPPKRRAWLEMTKVRVT